MSIADFYIEHGLSADDDVCSVLRSRYAEEQDEDYEDEVQAEDDEVQDEDDETVQHQSELEFLLYCKGYKEIPTSRPGMISYRQDITEYMLTFWLTTGTVGAYLEHPKQGKTQLFRRKVTFDEAKEIIKNPRQHTGSGYHTRKELKRKHSTSEEQVLFCSSCQKDKPSTLFSKNQRRKGNRGRCQDCVASS